LSFLYILTIAEAKSTIVLAILTVYHILKNTIRIDKIKNIKS